MEEKIVYTVEEAAKLLRVSRATAYEGIKTNSIPHIKIGRRVLVPKISLDKMLESAGAKCSA